MLRTQQKAATGMVSSRDETSAPPPRCTAPGCTNPLPAPGPGRPACFCSQACRARAWRSRQCQRGALVAEVDMGSTSSKGRRGGQIWMVRLRRDNKSVIVAIGLSRTCAEALAEEINALI
jgi:hypothetical protein